ncbi:MAG: M28 family peptidase [Nitrososphaerota archaeon]
MKHLNPSDLSSIIQEISKFGCRWLGSGGEQQTREFILSKFEDSEMDNIYLEWFPCHNYRVEEYSLEVTSPLNLSIRCEPLEYSENSDVEGELVFVGELREDLDPEFLSKLNLDLEEKICLMVSDTPAFYIPLLIEKGARGLVVATEAPDNLIRMLAAKSYPPSLGDPHKWKINIPGVSISKQDLYKILSLLSLGKVYVKLRHFGGCEITQTCNIVGVVEGHTDESIVIGAHYDSQMKTTGVWDNLTGVSILIELAKNFSKRENRKRIIFVAFGAEEIGLWGSTFFVEKHKKELKEKCRAMFCLDAVSSAFPTERSVWAKDVLRTLILEISRKHGYLITNTREPNLSYSDYYPFIVEDIPAAMIWEYPPINPYYHTEKDTARYIDVNKLCEMGELHRIIIEEIDMYG